MVTCQQEVINDDDAKLKFLQKEFGHDVCDAMKTALMEMNEYNPSERQPILSSGTSAKGGRRRWRRFSCSCSHI
jgi:hypothetical protein